MKRQFWIQNAAGGTEYHDSIDSAVRAWDPFGWEDYVYCDDGKMPIYTDLEGHVRVGGIGVSWRDFVDQCDREMKSVD